MEEVSEQAYTTASIEIDKMIEQAVDLKATDIHLEVDEEKICLRYRINGLLYDFPSPPKELYSAILARIKVLSDLDISQKRLPQSGYFQQKLKDRRVDLRVSTFPSIFGETIAMRVIDKRNIILGFEKLGLTEPNLSRYLKILSEPYGIILVTGPTGGGKTTTLYASLSHIRSARKRIITLEDPVEYHLPNVSQSQVNLKAGFTFSVGLRSILRQDPNVIMVGEIRDAETASIAIQVAQTGQLVFSTLHTNTAPGAVTRLLDMGIESFLVASSLVGVLSQTLVRTICPACKEEYQPTEEETKEIENLFKGDKIAFFRGKGCSKCNQTGFQSRTGLFELVVVDHKMRQLILKKPTLEELRKSARESGMITLREDGIEKAKRGITTLPEVLRVTKKE